MITDYLTHLKDMSMYCDDFKKWVVKEFFTDRTSGYAKDSTTPVESWTYYGHFCYHPEYQKRLETVKRCIEICHVFGIADLMMVQPELKMRGYRLGEPEIVKDRKEFEANIDFISKTFQGKGFPISGMISGLHPMERRRLVEAIHCLFEGCLYSAVAMATSTIEFRLLDFMKRINTESSKELEKKTLGYLIDECLRNPIYCDKLPERHHPLLKLCNEFRIFSVHPKTEFVTQNEAISVINLAFSFILDPRLDKVTK